ncbi:MAG: alcohol dehydrogenase catalytic domain-containing protein [Planctomycetota bacterium]
MEIRFAAAEYRADTTFADVELTFARDARGWRVLRAGAEHLALGPGYRPLRTVQCGVCSTDLARHFLPFPLPQVIGHELVAADDDGRRYVVEINASHHARGLDGAACAFCQAGLPTHCPDRLVLGIHDLPGGFGPRVLVPEHAMLPLPADLSLDTATLIEPFAAALHAVTTVAPRPGESIAVLGPRRLGLLVIAALAAHRRARNRPGTFEIVALARRPAMLEAAREIGADRGECVDEDPGRASPRFDVVIDTTGNPAALPLAAALARREVHIKSTHGQPSGGLQHVTELVVDELRIERLPEPTRLARFALTQERPPVIAWLAEAPAPPALRAVADLREGAAAAVLDQLAQHPDPAGLGRVDAAVVDTGAALDAAVRPLPTQETSLVRPRGTLLVAPSEPAPAGSREGSPGPTAAVDGADLLEVVAARGVRVSTSRCGDFATALALLAADPALQRLGDRLISHRYPATDLAQAFATARSPNALKVVVEHA